MQLSLDGRRMGWAGTDRLMGVRLFFLGRGLLRPALARMRNSEAHCAGHTRLAEYATLFRPTGCRLKSKRSSPMSISTVAADVGYSPSTPTRSSPAALT